VIFDFAPQIEIGAEILSRRGADQRLTEERPAARRRREKDRAYHADGEAPEEALAEPDEAPDADPSTGSGHSDAGSGRDHA
jgi:GTP-binding protein